MLQVNVAGGTNAGHRQAKPQAAHDWRCPTCKSYLRYYWLTCPNDGHPRP